jgi:MinD-like ATPase involved in chromosome partitioning or flagellar assembly
MTLFANEYSVAQIPQPVLSPQPGRVIACWGSAGSGKSLLALNLAFELASTGQNTLLIDADSYWPSLNAALGITEAKPGILAALRLARQGRLDRSELDRLTEAVEFDGHTLRFLPGLSSPGRWSELDEVSIEALVQFTRGSFDYLVVDMSSSLEDGLFAPQFATSRNQCTRTFLNLADVALASFLADPVGVNRFLWDIRSAATAVMPIANRVRTQSLGRNPDRQLKDALFQLAKLKLEHFLPEDMSAADQGLSRGRPLCIASKSSKLREAIRQLALELVEQGSAKLHNREQSSK